MNTKELNALEKKLKKLLKEVAKISEVIATERTRQTIKPKKTTKKAPKKTTKKIPQTKKKNIKEIVPGKPKRTEVKTYKNAGVGEKAPSKYVRKTNRVMKEYNTKYRQQQTSQFTESTNTAKQANFNRRVLGYTPAPIKDTTYIRKIENFLSRHIPSGVLIGTNYLLIYLETADLKWMNTATQAEVDKFLMKVLNKPFNNKGDTLWDAIRDNSTPQLECGLAVEMDASEQDLFFENLEMFQDSLRQFIPQRG